MILTVLTGPVLVLVSYCINPEITWEGEQGKCGEATATVVENGRQADLLDKMSEAGRQMAVGKLYEARVIPDDMPQAEVVTRHFARIPLHVESN